MREFWFLVVFVLPWFLFAYAIWSSYLQNAFTVEPNNRERLVIQNVLTGNITVLGPGSHPTAPWWKELERVDLNREPVSVPSKEHSAEEVKTSDGIRLLIEYRLDMLSGRPFHPDTGALGVYDPVTKILTKINVDDPAAVRDEEVVLAVTRIDFKQRETRIRDIVKASLEAELGHYKADELMTPEKNQPEVPKGPPPGPKVTSTADLYKELAALIEALANRGLLFVGINIVDFKITNLRFADDKLQQALENAKRIAKLREAALQAQYADPSLKGGDRISYREALAAGTDQYGTVTQAEAGRAFGEALADGLKKFGKG